MSVKRVLVLLSILVSLVMVGCAVVPDDPPDFEPYFVVSNIGPITQKDGIINIDFRTETAHHMKYNEDPESQDIFKVLEVYFNKQKSSPAKLIRTNPISRTNDSINSGGSYHRTSYIENDWHASLPVGNFLENGKYLLVFTGCKEGNNLCFQYPIPVCVQNNLIIGQPVYNTPSVVDRINAPSYVSAIDPRTSFNIKDWSEDRKCSNNASESLLNTDYHPLSTEPPRQYLPEGWSAKIGPLD
jgi:hypothetical protein